MAFVFVPPPQPSPRAHEMSRRVQAALDAYLVEHPGTTNLELRQAFELAFRALRRGSDPRAAIAVALGLAVAGLFAGLAVFGSRSPAAPSAPVFVIMAIAVAAIVAAAIVVFRKLR